MREMGEWVAHVKAQLLDLLLEAVTAEGGDVFSNWMAAALQPELKASVLEKVLEGWVLWEADDLIEDGKIEEAQRLRFLLYHKGLFEAIKACLELDPNYGELAGLAVGLFIKKKEYDKAIKLLKVCKSDGRMFWDT